MIDLYAYYERTHSSTWLGAFNVPKESSAVHYTEVPIFNSVPYSLKDQNLVIFPRLLTCRVCWRGHAVIRWRR